MTVNLRTPEGWNVEAGLLFNIEGDGQTAAGGKIGVAEISRQFMLENDSILTPKLTIPEGSIDIVRGSTIKNAGVPEHASADLEGRIGASKPAVTSQLGIFVCGIRHVVVVERQTEKRLLRQEVVGTQR